MKMMEEERLRRRHGTRNCIRERETANIDSLPDELLMEILLSDDPDHLYNNGRLVCRRWCHLIRSRNFIKAQLHRSTPGLVFCWDGSAHANYVTATQGRIERSEIYNRVPSHSYLQSSCNGLVLHHVMFAMLVTNPVTRQQFVLPPLSYENFMMRTGCALGYAAGSMEYKVAASCLKGDKELVESLYIWSVGRDESWRSVGVEHLPTHARRLLTDIPLVTDGSFIIWADYFYSGQYLRLDVETEILTFHPTPGLEYYPEGTKWVYLSTGRSVLSLLVILKNSYLMELWEMAAESGEWRMVMDDIKLGAQKRCWLGCRFCGGGFGYLMPFGWVRYPEVLALYSTSSQSTCIFFNLNTQEVSFMGLPRGGNFFSVHTHNKSLTWISP